MSTAQAATEEDKDVQSHSDDPGDYELQRPMSTVNHVYTDVDIEPEIHLRTYIALAAMLFLNYVQVIALQGPPVVVSTQFKSTRSME